MATATMGMTAASCFRIWDISAAEMAASKAYSLAVCNEASTSTKSEAIRIGHKHSAHSESPIISGQRLSNPKSIAIRHNRSHSKPLRTSLHKPIKKSPSSSTIISWQIWLQFMIIRDPSSRHMLSLISFISG
jgi:hypothetical protein